MRSDLDTYPHGVCETGHVAGIIGGNDCIDFDVKNGEKSGMGKSGMGKSGMGENAQSRFYCPQSNCDLQECKVSGTPCRGVYVKGGSKIVFGR